MAGSPSVLELFDYKPELAALDGQDCPQSFLEGKRFAFIRGVHSCPGAPLARTEGKISLNRILDRMTDFRISEEHHGPEEARRYTYEPTFIMRGLAELHLEFKPIP